MGIKACCQTYREGQSQEPDEACCRTGIESHGIAYIAERHEAKPQQATAQSPDNVKEPKSLLKARQQQTALTYGQPQGQSDVCWSAVDPAERTNIGHRSALLSSVLTQVGGH